MQWQQPGDLTCLIKCLKPRVVASPPSSGANIKTCNVPRTLTSLWHQAAWRPCNAAGNGLQWLLQYEHLSYLDVEVALLNAFGTFGLYVYFCLVALHYIRKKWQADWCEAVEKFGFCLDAIPRLLNYFILKIKTGYCFAFHSRRLVEKFSFLKWLEC